jgi:hypothetical protein
MFPCIGIEVIMGHQGSVRNIVGRNDHPSLFLAVTAPQQKARSTMAK